MVDKWLLIVEGEKPDLCRCPTKADTFEIGAGRTCLSRHEVSTNEHNFDQNRSYVFLVVGANEDAISLEVTAARCLH